MRFSTTLAAASLTLLAQLAAARDAAACGGCFGPPTENTQVAGHRMVMSISTTQSTLFDQLQYSGAPSSFAWVLPIKGQVDVGLSSDLLFQALDDQSAVSLQAPPLTCPPPPPGCQFAAPGGSDGAGGAGGAGGSGGGVSVISQETVGPYETVQLASTDPAALTKWLTDHGYAITPAITPVIQAYVSDGFDFLAMKLVPGQGVDAMRPVRVTSPGAGVSLPLRMVAAGAGATVPLKLFVVADGAWEPANFPDFRVDRAQLVWDWTTQSSNYAKLVSQGFSAGQGDAWLFESSADLSPYAFSSQILNTASYTTTGGYSADGGVNEATDDLATLFSGLATTSVRLTRLRAELPNAALSQDLVLRAATDQSAVSTYFQIQQSTGAQPCPDYSYCADGGAGGAGGGTGGAGGGVGGFGGVTVGTGGTAGAEDAGAAPGATASGGGANGCAVGHGGSSDLLGAGLAAAALLAARRRARSSDRKAG